MDTDEHEEDADQYRSGSKSSERSAAKATGSKAPLIIIVIVLLIVGAFVGLKVLGKKGTNGSSGSASGCGTPGRACPVAEIAKHNKQADCWVIYDGSYYNVTPFIAQHPGTPDAFNSNTCGHDITQYLKGQKDNDGLQHTHSQKAFDTIVKYKVGPVK